MRSPCSTPPAWSKASAPSARTGASRPADVIRTQPAAGEVVEPGTAVDLVVSLGPPEPPPPSPSPSAPAASELVGVPDVRGLAEEDAVAVLESSGLSVGERTERESPRVPQGSVIRTRPDAGQLVDSGTAVDIVDLDGRPSHRGPDGLGGTQRGRDARPQRAAFAKPHPAAAGEPDPQPAPIGGSRA